MGRATKRRPKRLAKKLLRIRLALGLSQNEMIRRLRLSDELMQASISGYELGTRVPPLHVLLRYAEVSGVCTDTLINDRLSLPAKLPAIPKHKP